MGFNLDLRHPRSFNEKLQFLKIYDKNPLYTTLVDKYLVKQWVAEKIGAQYVIPTLGVYDSVDSIDLDALPNQFVLKCNHDSGSYVICKDKSSFDFQAAKKKLDAALKTNYYWETREWPYKKVKPRIIAEEYKEDASGELRDYKVYAVNGRCDYLMLCFDRSKGKPKFLFFDREWNLHKELSNFGMLHGDSVSIEKPQNLDKFFERVEEKKNVRGRVVESGKIYELIFTSCDCPIHTEAGIESNRLCECSRQSMICVFKELVPERRFHIECIKSILSGDEVCCHKIIFDD